MFTCETCGREFDPARYAVSRRRPETGEARARSALGTHRRTHEAKTPKGPRRYVFDPTGADALQPLRLHPAKGAIVVKATPPRGCPPNGTMRHCYIADAETGRFYGLALEASLLPLRSSSESA